MKENKQLHWYAIYTKPRWEKKVDERLLLKNIHSWCPLQKMERQWSDRKKIIDVPVFKSYVFVQINMTDRLRVLQTEGVLNFVHHAGKPAMIREEEIDLIKSFLEIHDAKISTCSWESLSPDMKVKIQAGIFMDNTGTVLRTTTKKAYVRLDSLGQVMVVEFPLNYVRPL